jgi:hypothetical protein
LETKPRHAAAIALSSLADGTVFAWALVMTAVKDRSTSDSIDGGGRRVIVKEVDSGPLIDGSDAELYDETLVIVQIPSEPPHMFAERVERRLALAAHQAQRFNVAQLYVGLAQDQTQLAVRQSILVALATHLRAGTERSQLIIELPDATPADTRRRLFEAVDHMITSTRDGKLSVRFRIGASRSPRGSASGLAPRAERDDADESGGYSNRLS